MDLLGFVAVVAAVVLLLVSRRAAEHDVAGNPALRLRPPATALLPIALLFFCEALVFRIGPSFTLHPATFYVLLVLGALVLLCSVLLFSLHITVEPKRLVLQIPFLWRRSWPLSQFVEIQDDALIPIIVFAGNRRITVLPLYSGVAGFLDHLRAFHAELADRGRERA